jgi:hypothetical protein
MSARRDPDQLIHRFLLEGSERLHDQVYDAVRAGIEQKPQRVVIGPWRNPLMSKFLTLGLGAAAVVVALVVGTRLLAPPGPPGPGGAPVASPSVTPSATAEPSMDPTAKPEGFFGGIVHYQVDGADATTEVDAVADGASVTGTAVTTQRNTEHTVRLECVARDGDTWAVGGTIEESSVPGERPGAWSAVVVRGGSPQRVAVWLSDPKSAGSDCDGWLALIDLTDFVPEDFQPVESGALVPPPEPAP